MNQFVNLELAKYIFLKILHLQKYLQIIIPTTLVACCIIPAELGTSSLLSVHEKQLPET